MTTRAQANLVAALADVGAVRNRNDQELDEAYGGLCHKIPMLVMNDGLAQAVAWIEEKAAPTPDARDASALKRAYALQRRHIFERLKAANVTGESSSLITAVGSADNARYTLMTLTLLDAWVYYKRFASSLLGVTSATVVDEAEGDAE